MVVCTRCCITIAAVHLLNTTSKECLQQCNLRKLKAQSLWLDYDYRGIIAQSSDASFAHVHISYCHGDLC